MLLLLGALVALVWANTPLRSSYEAVSDFTIGPALLHLDLSLATWAADGLLAIFFFVVGVELKHEFVVGSLRNIKQAAVPVIAAVGGMAVPALFYVIIVLSMGEETALHGWAIPTATDIAFALAVLAVFGRGLPVALRTFLLTLAVVDDLLGITVIAVFYTESVNMAALAGATLTIALFAIIVRTRWARWWVLLPLAAIAWILMHDSGVHATVAGVLLGFTVPARPLSGEKEARTERYEKAVRPVSSGFALPVFAFFAAGVSVFGSESGNVFAQPVVLAIVAALVAGKLLGVLGMTALITTTTKLRLPDSIGIRDLLPVALLTGIGFTVSLLIAELSFPDEGHIDAAKVAILTGSVIAAVLAAVTLRLDARKSRDTDMNLDGVPDTAGPRIGD